MPAWESRSVHGRTVPLGCLLSLVEFFFVLLREGPTCVFFGKTHVFFFGL